jgi:2-polyprenyl-6-methoxyphenol hydroxylase-like FAD-dependent oxidoreductase
VTDGTTDTAAGTEADVVVVGAGAAGLAAARALGALGLRVFVFDRQRSPIPTPKGEILQPETVRIVDGWGALDALRDTGARPVSRLAIRDPAGNPLLSLDYGALPGAYREILCAEYEGLQAALIAGLAPGVRIRRGVKVGGVLQDGQGRVVGVRTDRAEIRAALVVAADGLSSPLRKAVGIEVEREEYPHRLIAFDVVGADAAPEVCAYRTVRGLCLLYPLPGGRARLYVQLRPGEFRAGGTADLAPWCEGVLAAVPALAPLEKAIRASLDRHQLLAVHRLRAKRLAAPGLALMGEAAHAVHPMAAQGVNSSLADAETLARALAAGDGLAADAVDRALNVFEAERRPRLDHTATVSHNAARMITALSGAPRLLGARMMRGTAANPRLLARTAGNLSGTNVRPLTRLDRLYQLGLLADRRAKAVPATSTSPDHGEE